MTDIPWGEQPTEDHVWVEDLDARNSDASCWVKESFLNQIMIPHKIHRKPEPKAFEPVAGEWCEVIFKDDTHPLWEKCELKYKSETAMVIRFSDDLHDTAFDHSQIALGIEFRPIKSDREVFIEKAKAVDPNIGKAKLNKLYNAGFKAPEGEL